MLERLTMSSAFIVVNHSIATLGTVAVAGYNLCGTAEAMSFMPGLALGVAATTLFGQAVGARRLDLAHLYTRLTLRIGVIVMVFMTAALVLGADRIIAFFTPDPGVIEIGGMLLRFMGYIQIPQVISMVYSGALKGAGDAHSPFVITLICMWGVRILGILVSVHLLQQGMRAIAVWICADNLLRFVLFHLAYRKGRWRKRLRLGSEA